LIIWRDFCDSQACCRALRFEVSPATDTCWLDRLRTKWENRTETPPFLATRMTRTCLLPKFSQIGAINAREFGERKNKQFQDLFEGELQAAAILASSFFL